ncbi:MAG: polyhydroxyalkanoate synthesis repressor PhaR [Pseudomonadota bacterium]
MPASKHKTDDGVIIIKKYANRRLYNTHSSSYITLDYIATLIRNGDEFKVIDAKSGDDITRSILTQIIMDEESGEEQILPTSFLRQIIGMYGNSMQAMMPGYLEASMQAFRDNQQKLQNMVGDSIANNPFAKIAQRNMEMFETAVRTFTPKAGGSHKDHAKTKPAEPSPKSDDIDALKQQLAAMQRQLDNLTQKD